MITVFVRTAASSDIPAEVLFALENTVALRKQAAEFFAVTAERYDDEMMRRSNDSHRHTIKVLDTILCMLQKVAGSDISAVATSSSGSARELKNRFESLEKKTHQRSSAKTAVVEPSLAASQQETAKDADDRPWLQYHDSDEDSVFAYCILYDCEIVRDFVVERWCDIFYGDRPVTIEILGSITNAAFELFHKFEADVKNKVLGLDGEQELVQSLFRNSRSENLVEHLKRSSKITHCYSTIDPAEKELCKRASFVEIIGDFDVVKRMKTDKKLDFVLPGEPEFVLDIQDFFEGVEGR
ncbi:hypothetical protein QBC38DRAFT_531175 [Podospora fimiseda]|uniref:DUF6604 domain-containing protein n=1 Tax=Podospora fimiseda TaxID=252190 RepID=A0AAN7BKM7_9PEZI|nr:hypothetical protein QBC38DRAFT_531175 [Podospora fimiseda]